MNNKLALLRELIEEALWFQAEGKDYYKAPLSVRREILDVAMPIIAAFFGGSNNPMRLEGRKAFHAVEPQGDKSA